MSLEERVAATFISRYFELLMTDSKQLVSFYLPKAQFNHEGKTTSIIGSENIAKALSRLYAQPNHGRVTIKDMQIKQTESSAGRFAVSIGGTYYRRGAFEGEEFRHVVELQEHQGSNGVYGIYADTRTVQKPQTLSTWAMETPPMFAKAGNEAAIPEIVQPPASEPAVIVEAKQPVKEPTPQVSPQVSPSLKPQPAVATEEAAPAVQTSATVSPTTEGEAAAAPKAPASFLDMVRARASKPVQNANVARIEGKSEEVKAKEEAERLAKEEAAKKEKEAAQVDRKRPTGKPSGKKEAEDTTKAEVKPKSAAAPAAADKRRGDKVLSHSVVFYDVIVKGLPRTATEKSVEDMIAPMAPVKKINVKSQADKKDSSITRTFAFVLFDHEAIVAGGSTVSATIQRVTKEGTQKFTAQRIQIDEVREKFTQEDPREKAE